MRKIYLIINIPELLRTEMIGNQQKLSSHYIPELDVELVEAVEGQAISVSIVATLRPKSKFKEQ